MNRIAFPIIAATLLLLSATGVATEKDAEDSLNAEQKKLFSEQVLPILEDHCWECHGQEVQESGLRLDSRQSLLDGGNSGKPIVKPGKAAESYLIQVLDHDGDVAMPPDDKLENDDIQSLTRWVNSGIPWSIGDSKPAAPLSKEERYLQQLKTHWAFQPIEAGPMPSVRNAQWIAQPVDAFILAHLENQGLAPSPVADRFVLIRRLKFDLLGLPPTYDEVRAFENDSAPGAYERLVDRYLASPHYGERWGRHWLDLARYADTRGYAFNRERRYPYAYTYRDYVIEALNQDLPFDQFVIQQLAADLLGYESNDPRLAALGFLTVGRKFNNRHLDIDDQIDVVGRGLLGLTVACARCHDHKYDPIPTEDYYSLYGVFASSSEPTDLPTIGDPSKTPGYADFKKKLDGLQAELDAFKKRKRDGLVETARNKVTDYLVRAISRQPEELLQKMPFISLRGEDLKPKLVQSWRQYLVRTAKADHPVLGPLYQLALIPDNEFAMKAPDILKAWQETPPGISKGQLNPLVKEALRRSPPISKIDLARVYGELFSAVYGDWKKSNADSRPAKDASSDADAQEDAELDPPSLRVVQILTDPGSPINITADQVVGYLSRAERNKLSELQRKIEAFQVDSPGAPPRAMVLQQSTTPHNPRVFIRGNHARPGKAVPRRLPLAIAGRDREPFVRDSGRLELARAVASPDNPLTARVAVNRVWMHHFGKPLVSTPSDFGMRSQRPVHADTLDFLASQLIEDDWSLKALHRLLVLSNTYRQSSMVRDECDEIDPENMFYWRANRRRLEFEAMRDAMLSVAGQLDTRMGGRPDNLTTSPYSLRRAVYGYIDRQDLPGLFRVFDLASPDQSCPERSRTTVPQQALFLMNSPFVIDRARQIIKLPVVVEATETADRIDAVYRVLFARSPSARELEIGRKFVGSAAERSADENSLGVWQQYAQLLMMSNAFMFVD